MGEWCVRGVCGRVVCEGSVWRGVCGRVVCERVCGRVVCEECVGEWCVRSAWESGM